MKKILFFITLITSSVFITSCGGKQVVQSATDNMNSIVSINEQTLQLTPIPIINNNNETPKPIEESQSDDQLLDSWLGDYIFTEYIDSGDYTKFYEVFISKENNEYTAKIKIDDTGEGTYSSLQAEIKGDDKQINFIFSDYLLDEQNTNKPFKLGDNLLRFTKTETGIKTHWDKIVPTNDINKADGTYFKVRENSDGYLGHWYTEIPFTGGNSTTIEIKEMSNTSVSFHLYFSRTYYYDGINVKLENNIAKFVDNDGEYIISGTIEFVNKSIIVNIEKSTFPILSIGETIFNYKVSEFAPVYISPSNDATDVDLGKGIEIDFGRTISPNVNPSEYITKANVSNDSDDGFAEMTVEIKGTKLIFLPAYDAMKMFNEVIEPGQKYVFTIEEGVYSDEVGNINSEIRIEFTTKS